MYEITISGTSAIHFDLYDSIVSGNRARAVFAPFSHDAEGHGDDVPDGGSTLALFGLGLAIYDYEMQIRFHKTVIDDEKFPVATEHP